MSTRRSQGEAEAARHAEAVALADLASQSLHANRPDAALTSLRRAVELAPNDPRMWLRLAATHRACRDYEAASRAIDQALSLQPRHFHALLMKASMLEAAGKLKSAALAYGLALAVAPPDEQLDAASLQTLRRGRQLNYQHVLGLRQHMGAALAQTVRQAGPSQARRILQFVDLTVGLKRRFRQEPTDYFYPGLPALEFWDRGEFPWLSELESATEAIQRELTQVLAADHGFAPYVQYGDAVPMDQWRALNHSMDWSAFHFFHYGRRYEENCRRCPATMSALALLPQPDASGRMPAAMFSLLKPKTRIPPHTGIANIRLVVHLPLLVPPACGFRVGNEVREWRVGEAWIFDDTIEHEAWNESEHPRAILIADIWNPRLDESEREAISIAMSAMDEFNEFSSANPGGDL